MEKGRRVRDQESDKVLARILVVDNDPGLLEWVDTAMARRHVLAYCAAAPAQAMELLQIERPGLILVDVDVPGTSVTEQLGEILPHALSRGVPLYVMTGLPQRDRVPQGVAGCIRKPFSTDELMALVRKHVEIGDVPAESEQVPVALG
jgi:DNA-binding response OmpR family regulator